MGVRPFRSFELAALRGAQHQERRGLVTFGGGKGLAKLPLLQYCTVGTFAITRARVYIYKKRERGHNEKIFAKSCKKICAYRINDYLCTVTIKQRETMKELKFKFDLSSRVAIYVPGTINVNQETDNAAQVERVMSKLSEWFGGATASDARGGWLSQSSGLVIEHVTIVYAFCKEADLQSRFDDIIALCESVRDDMQQEAVTLEINGQIAFI